MEPETADQQELNPINEASLDAVPHVRKFVLQNKLEFVLAITNCDTTTKKKTITNAREKTVAVQSQNECSLSLFLLGFSLAVA